MAKKKNERVWPDFEFAPGQKVYYIEGDYVPGGSFVYEVYGPFPVAAGTAHAGEVSYMLNMTNDVARGDFAEEDVFATKREATVAAKSLNEQEQEDG